MCCALVVIGLPASAQSNQVTLDVSVIRGTVGYARAVHPAVHLGLEAGFGFPQLDRTLVPDQNASGDPDFEEYLHLAAFARLARSEHFEVDLGVRGAIADLWPCGASDCLPTLFGGVYVQPMVGWRRLKFGPRLTFGWIGDAEPGVTDGATGVIGLSPLNARYTLPW
ncbi:MAG: hypothetical protein ACRELV_01735 [Longimicrobiales bacterium]